uniref:Uncharacterized protein n=1 Tax=Erpetoichthys calabaricus TaxID=27687 RepID=A0A8C4RF81_ERPCA
MFSPCLRGFVEQASQILTCTKMANEYVLPKERITVNKIFVGGIDMKVMEMKSKIFFFSVSFKGRKLKLGPDITKAQISYSNTSPGCPNEIQPIVKDIHNTGNPYVQPNHYPGVLTFVMSTYIPQPVYMFQNATAQWTNFTDTGVQTWL